MSETETKQEKGFLKEDILKSERYKDKTDLIMAFLMDGRTYALKEVDAMITKYEKGRVK